MGDVTLYTVLPTHTAEAGILLASVGILLSANRFIRLGANGAAGWLCDRWPRRRLFVLSLLVGALSTAICALTQGFWPLLLGRLLWGVAWSGIWVAGNAIVFDIAALENRGRLVGSYHVSFFLGGGVGSILGGLLTDWLGYHWTMAIAAGLALAGVLIAWLFLPETGHFRQHLYRPVATSAPATNPHLWQIPQLASATALLGVNRVVIAGLLASTFGIFLLERFGDSLSVMGHSIGVATLTGLGLGLSTFLGIVFTPLFGGLSDRAGNRWRVAVGGLLSGVAGFGLLAWGLPAAVLLGLPLTAVASSSNQGLSTALVGDLSSEAQRGRFLGILFTVGDLGSAIGPLLAYALLPLWGIAGVYWLSAGLFILILLLAIHWSIGQPRHLTADEARAA
jgi:MFS family permease